MEFLVLGPIEVRSAGSPIHIGGVKQRSILALLIANRGRAVSTDRIVLDIYGEDAPAGARRSVQSIVSMLRRDLGDVIVGSGEGYVLDVAREAVDATRFEDGVAAGLAVLNDDPSHAAALLRDALALWRGDAYADVDGRAVFEPEIVRLAELRLGAIEARIEADLASGRHREALGELEALAGEYPLREKLWGLWMLALYRVGRQAEALGAFQTLRVALGEGLGIDPSVELQELEEQILLHDPELDLVSPVPHNLPAQLTSFVGRSLELIEIGELLADRRLVTLTGAGGCGKTRLAVELARGLLDDYPDGVWFVDFRGVASEGVASHVVSTLHVVLSADRPLVDQLVDALWSRRLLLVLDNCEHVLDGVAPLVERLVGRDGVVRVLATSRERLGVPGEKLMGIHPLRVPESADADEVAGCEASVLFSDRARGAQSDFVLDEHFEAVFGICRAVEGLPLALELAAARLLVVSPEELADRLDDQLGMLRTTQKAGDLRHSTIEATIRWSWDLLAEGEQMLLGRLSVFRGTWSIEAAEAVCGFAPIGHGRVLDLLGELVAKSLIVVEGVEGGSTRYRLLEPIGQFAARQVDSPATQLLQHRLVNYWAATLAGSYEPEVRFAWRDHQRARALEVDQANLKAAVEYGIAMGRVEDALRIFASPFGDLMLLQGSGFETAARWIDAGLQSRKTISPGVLLTALEVAGSIAELAQQFEVMLRWAETAIEVSRTSEERLWFELVAAAAMNWLEGHSDATNAMFDRVIARAENPDLLASAYLAKALNNKSECARSLTRLAMDLPSGDSPRLWDECRTAWRVFDVAEDLGEYDLATPMAERTLDLSRHYGWRWFQSKSAARLAYLYAAQGRLDEAAALVAEAVPIARRILGPSGTSGSVLWRAAVIARLEGDFGRARSYVDAILNVRQLGSRLGVVVGAIVEAALIARDEGDLKLAAERLGDAASRHESVENRDFLQMTRFWVCNAGASIDLFRGDPEAALVRLRPVLAAADEANHLSILEMVDLAAIAFALQGRAELAAWLKGAVDRERENCGLVVQPPDEPVRKKAMRHARSVYDGDWTAAVDKGRALTLDDAIELARVEASSAGEGRANASPGDS